MANFFNSVGYALGKLHSGMIVYLCDLFNEGNKEPLTSFFDSLGIPIIGEKVYAEKEYKRVDLVIFSDKKKLALFEIKVDDHESWGKKYGYQTERYLKLIPDCTKYLYVTLGAGEYYCAPHEKKFDWIRIKDFLKAIESIREKKDCYIADWKSSVVREIELQDLAIKNDASRINEYRTGTWNIYTLGKLKETLLRYLKGNPLDEIEPKAYMYGTRPDTILNFWWGQVYTEINNNARLNLKVSLENFNTEEEKKEFVNKTRENYFELLQEFKPVLNNRAGYGNSKTIMSFDIGLSINEENGLLYFKEELDIICKIIARILAIVLR